MALGVGLPPSLASLYRLFLRAASASVLDQRTARKELRKLWRPNFETAARIIRDIERADLAVAEKARRKEWLRVWEQRGACHVALFS